MASTPPVSFRVKAQTAANPAVGGYPYSLKADDLDENFVFATEDFSAEHFVTTTALGMGGHSQRKITLALPIPELPTSGTHNLTASSGSLTWAEGIPTPPTSGTHVLGAVDGALTWIATEEC